MVSGRYCDYPEVTPTAMSEYICTMCGKSFQTRDDLVHHQDFERGNEREGIMTSNNLTLDNILMSKLFVKSFYSSNYLKVAYNDGYLIPYVQASNFLSKEPK